MIKTMLHFRWMKLFGEVWVALFFILSSGLTLSAAEGDPSTPDHDILVIGEGSIHEGNIAGARRSATSDALVKGVEIYLGRALGARGMSNNFPRLVSDLLPGAREYIENFNILAEERTKEDYKILVRVKINEKLMEEKLKGLGLMLAEGGPPVKVLFMVSQEESQEGKVSAWWSETENVPPLTPTELFLHRAFGERGFMPINRQMNMPEEGIAPEMRALNLSHEALVNWGRAFSSEVVIHGKCVIIEGEQLTLNLAVLDVEKETVILQDVQSESLEGGIDELEEIIPILKRAINRLAMRIGPAIIKAVEVPEAKTNTLEIMLRGLQNFKQFREFKDFLEREVKGVQTVKQTKVKGKAIYVAITYTGDEDRFLERILNHEKLPFQAEIFKSDEGEIILDVK